jgi:hypothetical protein
MPGHVCLETVTFTERGDTTTVTQAIVYQWAQDRDRCCATTCPKDIHESIGRLEQVLAQLIPAS